MGKVNSIYYKIEDYLVAKIVKRPLLAILIFVVFIIFIIVISLTSYAYFNANVQGTGKQITVSTSNAIVHFTDNNEINETGITPGTTITKTFYITNTAHGSLQYKINWEYLINNFTYRNCLKYTITSTGGGGTLSSTQVPDSEDHINILNNVTIPGNTTQNYTMTITYEDNGQNQDADKNKSLIGKLEVTDIEGNSIAPQTSTGTYTAPITSGSSLYGKTLGQLMSEVYPVGSIYTSTSSTDPSELFPGTTWERYAKGKTLVGVDENDTAFNTVNKTGGMKDAIIPYHRHELNGQNALAASAGAHTHDISGSTSTDGAHTHTIAANGISVRSTATTISTAMPDQLTEEFEDGVNYGEHGHNVTATGTNTNSYTISSSGAHTHTTTAKTGLTTGSESSHTHTIAAATYTNAAVSKTLTGSVTIRGFNAGSMIVSRSGIVTTSNQSSSSYSTDSVNNKYRQDAITITATHAHNVTIPQHSTGAGSAHSHTFDIPALDIESSGAHSHTIATGEISFAINQGSTVDSGHSGWHVHTVTIPQLTSTNNSSITVPNTGSGHSHTVTGTAESAGAHEHTLSGYSAYVGTSGNTTNANLQPYTTVYMWKRVS